MSQELSCRLWMLGNHGGWDFTLSYSRMAGCRWPCRPAETLAPGSQCPGCIRSDWRLSIFEALEKQIGLKLEMPKRPAPMFVIDHLEQKPTDNYAAFSPIRHSQPVRTCGGRAYYKPRQVPDNHCERKMLCNNDRGGSKLSGLPLLAPGATGGEVEFPQSGRPGAGWSTGSQAHCENAVKHHRTSTAISQPGSANSS